MTSPMTAKRDVQKLQRAIVDGLEDVKAQDIRVFNTEHLSPLFERVVVASGASNRQTKALAASVTDAVRDAGFPKPRIEGEENGEWIIVDCGAAVVHVMQPAIRQYYQLEDIWGEKPVRLRFGAPAPVVASNLRVAPVTKTGPKPKSESARSGGAGKVATPPKASRGGGAPAKAARPAKSAPKVSTQSSSAKPKATNGSRKPAARKS